MSTSAAKVQKSGFATICPICNKPVRPGDNVMRCPSSRGFAHAACLASGDKDQVDSPGNVTEAPKDHDNNKSDTQNTSPTVLTGSETPVRTVGREGSQIRTVVLDVLAECFGGVDFSFLDELIDRKVSEAISRRETPF